MAKHQRSPEFDQHTRGELEAAYRAALLKVNPEYYEPERQAQLFVAWLEGLAEPPHISEPDAQQRRREKLEAFANSLDKSIDAAVGMDDPALGYALWRGLSEMVKLPEFSNAEREAVRKLEGVPMILKAHELQNKEQAALRQFALGVRTAIRELPKLDRDSYSFEAFTARGLDDYLTRREIPFTTSETGLAGKAFDAVMALAGVKTGGASYWLGKAAKDEGSFRAMIRKFKGKVWH